jgi:hypothetical protein
MIKIARTRRKRARNLRDFCSLLVKRATLRFGIYQSSKKMINSLLLMVGPFR